MGIDPSVISLLRYLDHGDIVTPHCVGERLFYNRFLLSKPENAKKVFATHGFFTHYSSSKNTQLALFKVQKISNW